MLAQRDLSPAGHSGATAVIIVAAVFPALCTLAVVSRFVSIWLSGGRPHLDDWVIIPALIVEYGQIAVIIWSVVDGGVGYHVWELSGYNISVYAESLTIVQFFFDVSLGLAKVAICLFIMRVFHPRSFWILGYLVLAYQLAWTLAGILKAVLICRPFEYNWNKSIDGTCGDRKAGFIAMAVTDLVGDLLLILLPLPLIWKLKTSLEKKLGLSVIFSLGLMDVACAILRIVFIERIDYAGDFTYQSVEGWIWSTIEPALAIIVACAPTVHPLLRTAYKRAGSEARSLISKYTRSPKASIGSEHKSEENLAVPNEEHGDVSRLYPELHDPAQRIEN